MRTNPSSHLFWPCGLVLVQLVVDSSLGAAPLTWFPGPSLYDPVSAAATVSASGFGNVLVGGTAYFDGLSYPVYLIATNQYWSGFGYVNGVNVAGGAAVI